MRTWIVVAVGVALLWQGGLCQADEPAREDRPSLEQLLDDLDQVDQELAETQQQLEHPPTPADRQHLQDRLEQLETTQERLLQELEALIGELPPAVRDHPPSSLEETLEFQQYRHDIILESDVEQRLPSD